MRQVSWWRQTGRARLGWLAAATGLVAVSLFVLPALAPYLGNRVAGLLRPTVALALLGGLLLVAGDALAALHKRHDRADD